MRRTGCWVTTAESAGASMGCCCWGALTSGILRDGLSVICDSKSCCETSESISGEKSRCGDDGRREE